MPSLSPQLAVEKFRVAFSIGVPSAPPNRSNDLEVHMIEIE